MVFWVLLQKVFIVILVNMLGSYKVRNKKFYNVEFDERVLSIRRVVKVVKG